MKHASFIPADASTSRNLVLMFLLFCSTMTSLKNSMFSAS